MSLRKEILEEAFNECLARLKKKSYVSCLNCSNRDKVIKWSDVVEELKE